MFDDDFDKHAEYFVDYYDRGNANKDKSTRLLWHKCTNSTMNLFSFSGSALTKILLNLLKQTFWFHIPRTKMDIKDNRLIFFFQS
mmetsp:Transcript_15190/g.20053  ORF Transcript_15190/g.20053 Transcript_15190/m.20053 type:complete len:85 (+) Transcript_15190:922-1176(+)